MTSGIDSEDSDERGPQVLPEGVPLGGRLVFFAGGIDRVEVALAVDLGKVVDRYAWGVVRARLLRCNEL